MQHSKSNQVIQGFWLGESLSVMEQLCIRSFQQNGHSFHLYVYDVVKNVPEKTEMKDANQIIPYDRIFKDSRGSYASFADWFRYQLLYDKGGWWVDMDTICVKYFDIRPTYCFSSEKGIGIEQRINNGIIKSPSNAGFLIDLLEYVELKRPKNSKGETVHWGEFGPRLLSNVLQKYESEEYIQIPEVFCPISPTEISKLICKQDFILDEHKIYAVHFWNEIWRLANLDKNAEYHPDSLFEKMKSKYIQVGT